MSWAVGVLSVVVVLYFAVPWGLRALIRRRLGGYLRDANVVDSSKPERLPDGQRVRVAVLGSGIAGLTTAVTLARRGFQVTLFEANSYIGGKLGSWPVDLTPSRRVWVSHGFHAFFPNYFNFNRFLDSLGLRRSFTSIGAYVIVGYQHTVRFENLDKTPVFNLLSLARKGVFKIRDTLKAPGRDLYGLFLEYDHATTGQQFDHLSFADFDRLAKVPVQLKLAFNTFARAFFADEDKLSLAELLKSFHFYYLGQDHGLVYDYPQSDYEPALLAPLRAELQRHGAQLRLSTRVDSLERVGEGTFTVNAEPFEKVVVATDVVGANSILSKAQGVPASLRAQFAKLQPGQRYAVLRVWVDKDVRADMPPFVITDREKVLDAVSVYHRIEPAIREDLERHPGYVLELHCYAVPEAYTEQQVRDGLLEELQLLFPETKGLTVAHEVFQLKRDFTAFHVNQHADRPTVETGVAGLYCAGDWVKLPFPAMLMECACSSGLWAANGVLREAGLREELVQSVPLKGLLAGAPQPPARKALLRGA